MIVAVPTAPAGVSVRMRVAPLPVTEMPLLATTAGLDDTAVRVRSAAVYAASVVATDAAIAGLAASPSAAVRPTSAGETVGPGPGRTWPAGANAMPL